MKFDNIKEIAARFGFNIIDLDTIENTRDLTVFAFQKADKSSYMYLEVSSELESDGINTLEFNVVVNNNYVLSGEIKNDIVFGL